MTGTFHLDVDPARLQLDVIHAFLTESYWSPGIDRATLARAIAHSRCVGAFDAAGAQIGFARAVTDCATFAWLADVFVLPSARGQGIARAMVARLMADKALTGLRRWLLVTRDAHAVYAGLGFAPVGDPARIMERLVTGAGSTS